MTTGELIKKARKEAGLTQLQLAERLGIPYQSIGQWERNVRNPKYDTLKKIANALNTEWTELVPEIEQVNAATKNKNKTIAGSELSEKQAQEKILASSEGKAKARELKVGNTYFDGAMVLSQLDENPGKLMISFEVDDEKLKSSDINSLLNLFSKIAERENVTVEGMPQLLELLGSTNRNEETSDKENE